MPKANLKHRALSKVLAWSPLIVNACFNCRTLSKVLTWFHLTVNGKTYFKHSALSKVLAWSPMTVNCKSLPQTQDFECLLGPL